MRLVTWNCNLSLGKKIERLLNLNADIAIIQECEQELILPSGYQYIWRGNNPKKGLGVIGKNLEMIVEPNEDKFWTYFIPFSIPQLKLRILALWAYNHRAVRFGHDFNGNALSVINQLEGWLSSCPSLVVGDFNNSVIWDKVEGKYNFKDINQKLNQIGLSSAYHKHRDIGFGLENEATFFHTKNINKPYHIDYCYAHRSLSLEQVKILDFKDWQDLSDHVPVVVDFS